MADGPAGDAGGIVARGCHGSDSDEGMFGFELSFMPRINGQANEER